jgi:hypothetical protein
MRITSKHLRLLASVAVAAIAGFTNSYAQHHPSDTNATVIDSFHVAATIDAAEHSFDFDLSNTETTRVTGSIFVWATSNGKELTISTSAVAVASGESAIDQMGAATIVAALSNAAVDSALARRSIIPPSSGTLSVQVRHSACMIRSGSGDSTSFAPGAPGSLAARSYSIGPTPFVVVQYSGSSGCPTSGCSTGSEIACE